MPNSSEADATPDDVIDLVSDGEMAAAVVAEPIERQALVAEKPLAHPAPDTAITGGKLQTARDVAELFEVPTASMLYALFRADDSERYTEFQIPKRSGGMRPIGAPVGLTRTLQEKLLPLLAEVYTAHPSAHGFVRGRSIVSNAGQHVDQHLVLNIDLEGFFPTINFGRIRGLLMAPPFSMAPAAATVMAQIATFRNGLPQGAPTSPVLSNFIAASLDRRLSRLARNNRMRYSRYADDITFSTSAPAFPPSVVIFTDPSRADSGVTCGEALDAAITACGFKVNQAKVRLQRRHVQQSVTGIVVNKRVNVERLRIRRLRAMLHAWKKFGLAAAGNDHFNKHGGNRGQLVFRDTGKAFRNVIYGQLAYVKMVRGADDPVFLNLCAKLINLDPNPSRFIRQMVFGADDYELFISHASEDKPEVARPIFQACEKLGLKAFLDEQHIGWGENFSSKINTALGAARTVLVIVSPTSVTKPWPVAEVNTALSLEIAGEKSVLAVMVGTPDLTKLPLLRAKDYLVWSGDAMAVAKELKRIVRRESPPAPPPKPSPPSSAQPRVVPVADKGAAGAGKRSLMSRLLGRK